MGIHKKVFSIVLIFIILVSITGCFVTIIRLETENKEKYNFNDYIYGKSEDLDKLRLNDITITASMPFDNNGNYDIWIIIFSKEKNREIILKDVLLKTETNEILLEKNSLNESIFTDEELSPEYKPGYIGGLDIGEFPETSVKPGMKLFLTINVESEFGERKEIEYTFTANAYVWGETR